MRSKKLARHLKKAFDCSMDEESFPKLLLWVQSQVPEGPERDTLVSVLGGLPEFFNQIEQSYTQNEERIDMAHRSLEVSSKELTEVNRNLFSLNQTFDAMVNSQGQGFFLFSKDGYCLPICSKACETLLETVPKGQRVTDVFKVPAEKQLGFLDWCSILFEELIEFEELAQLGPKFFDHSEGRVVALEYKPVRNRDQSIEAVVVIATDRTEEVDATRKAIDVQAYASLVVSILKDRPRFAQFVRHSRHFFQEIKDLLKNQLTDEAATIIKRHLHTLKGAAATFGMVQIKDKTHQIETDIANYHGLPALRVFLQSAILDVELLFESLLIANKEVIGDILQGASATREVPVQQLEEFAERLKDFKDLALHRTFVEEILCVRLWDSFAQFNQVVESTARSTGKKASQIVCTGDNPSLFPEAYENVFESLNHLFRNLVDHGIEIPEVRQKLGKPEEGQIFIRCREIEFRGAPHIELRVSDDGKGIDPENIRRRLVSNKDPSAAGKSPEELIHKIFDAGFSTATTVTEISGRGVGLDVVRSAILQLHGTITVESTVGIGTTFCIVLPLIQFPKVAMSVSGPEHAA